MKERQILHVDVNNAFLSWTAVHMLKNGHPIDIRTIPSIIGGDEERRSGIVLAKSPIAKKFGVVTGEPIYFARKKCNRLETYPANFEVFKKYSDDLYRIFLEYTDQIERFSIDECFLDMTGYLNGRRLIDVANEINKRVEKELGFTVNVGVSSNKLLAKMASDFEKPDKVHTLYVDEIKEKLWPLPVGDLLYVGKSTVNSLAKLGIHTVGELATTDVKILVSNLKKQGEAIWRFANGLDMSMVETEPEANKGYGNSTTIPFDVSDEGTAKMVLLSLSEKVAARIREDGVVAESVSVTIKDFMLQKCSHQMILENKTNITSEIHEAACKLFDELWDGTPIRLLGVQVGKVSNDTVSRQISLFDDTDYEKLEAVDKAIDKIRSKYGNGAIKRAVFMKGE